MKFSLIFTLLISINASALIMNLKGKREILSKTLILDDNSIIRGPGILKIKSKSDGIILNGKNITIENVSFEVEDNTSKHNSVLKLTEKSNFIKISGNSFKGARYTILKADINTTKDKQLKFKNRAGQVIFEKNKCAGQFSRHLYLSSIENLKIINNTFSSSVRDSIRLRQNIINVLISGNSFVNIGVKSKESSDAIDSYWSGEEMIISNNHFDTIATHALDIKGISPDLNSKSSKVIISSNLFKNIQYSGVLISSGAIVKGKENRVDNFIIQANNFESNNLNGKNKNDAAIFIRHGVKNTLINANIINAKKSHAVVVASFEKDATQTSDTIISANVIESNFEPIYLVATKNTQVLSNILKPNKVKRLKKSKGHVESEVVLQNNL